jgi:DEAD/DEAH box helicase domain-containing protein
MRKQGSIEEYVASLKASRLGGQIVFHEELPASGAIYASPSRPWPAEVGKLLSGCGIQRLYSHQARAIDLVRSGRHTVIASPTASGKTMVYNLPVIEKVLADPSSHALYLFPLKALAQDQMKTFCSMTANLDRESAPDAAIYDGDTTTWKRKRLRDLPPNVLMTNPEMLHLSFLAHHDKWASFWSGLTHVVVDEVHTYRGVMGSHMAWVFRRMNRICTRYGASPTFVFCSATVGNPSELASRLTGLEVEAVRDSGAPQSRRHLLFMNPDDGAAQAAIRLLQGALKRGLRTIVYCQSRKLTELIALWAAERAGELAPRISAYRAGFLPEERREIEGRLASGELLAVISTSALELGIDIGTLDLCLLVGYPGTVMATRQRGGRVGRGNRDSAVVLIAQEDALDQYFMRNPRDLLQRPPEAAVLNPGNPVILARHLVCAASEVPIRHDEPIIGEEGVRESVSELTSRTELLASADGTEFYAARRAPHRRVDLRGAGHSFQIVANGRTIGQVDGFRAYRETHTGAVYLHKGLTYVVDKLDLDSRTAEVSAAKVDFFTRVRGHKTTEILETTSEQDVFSTRICLGRLRVTDQVTGYERRLVRDQRLLNRIPLDLPPQVFETDGLWIEIPKEIQEAAEEARMHFMGGIHALEHAAIGILPLLVLTDRNDLGGISTPLHHQIGRAAVFIYDGIPGGVGLSREAFAQAETLIRQTFHAIQRCPCTLGCPSCVHSPKCGSGNRPIDKASALFVLNGLIEGDAGVRPAAGHKMRTSSPEDSTGRSPRAKSARRPDLSGNRPAHFGVFDLETQLSAQEVGGWHRADLMKMSCAVLYDSRQGKFLEFFEEDIQGLVECLSGLELVVGFNVKRFDFEVLRGYSDFDFLGLPTLDILEEVHRRLGYRLSLDHLAQITLGKKKAGDGLQALRWWKEGRLGEIVTYCRQDVALTRDLFLYGQQKGYLLFRNKSGKTVQIPTGW